jgi:hypothetical protein
MGGEVCVIRLVAILIVRLAASMMPAGLSDWGRGMRAEADLIAPPSSALLFAFGCLGCAIREAVNLHLLHPPCSSGTAGAGARVRSEISPMPLWKTLAHRPRILAACCAVAATGLGLSYMAAAGAPNAYLVMNAGALGLGLFLAFMLAWAARPGGVARGLVGLVLASALLLTALLGISADGVTRWISAGGIVVQPSLILLPILVLNFARTRGLMSDLAILLAALALALQPDRAMAAALLAAMAALALVRRDRTMVLALGGAFAAAIVTLVRPDRSPAVPFVDQIFYSSFAVHSLAGVAVVAGAALMIVPAIVGSVRDAANREAYAVFGAVWLAIIVAAALGNYPTPLVGYGGSAILGYLISLLGLPPHSDPAIAAAHGGAAHGDVEHFEGRLRASLS